jgi:hypothetical protein
LFDNPPQIRSATARSRGLSIFDHSFSDANIENIPATAFYSIEIQTIAFVIVAGCRTASKDTGGTLRARRVQISNHTPDSQTLRAMPTAIAAEMA